MAQQILLRPALGEAARGRFGPLPRRPPFAPRIGEPCECRLMLRHIVEQRAVGRRVQQPALLALPLDLDEAVAELA